MLEVIFLFESAMSKITEVEMSITGERTRITKDQEWGIQPRSGFTLKHWTQPSGKQHLTNHTSLTPGNGDGKMKISTGSPWHLGAGVSGVQLPTPKMNFTQIFLPCQPLSLQHNTCKASHLSDFCPFTDLGLSFRSSFLLNTMPVI